MGAQAQIIEDARVRRTDRTILRRDESLRKWIVEGGSIRGKNLFHLFSDFNPGNDNVDFVTSKASDNVFAIVNGKNTSNINGVISVIDNNSLVRNDVAFYLVNPNGINIDERAFLNFQGDLFLSTSDQIGFGRQGSLNVGSQTRIPLLSVNPTDFAFRQGSGKIIVNGFLNGRNISLLGGDIDIQQGGLISTGGRLFLGSLSDGTLSVNPSENNIRSLDSIGGDIRIIESILVQDNTEGVNPSTFRVVGRRVILDRSTVLSFGVSNGIEVISEAGATLSASRVAASDSIGFRVFNGDLKLINGSALQNFDRGDISLNIGGRLHVGEILDRNGSRAFVRNENGNIFIRASSLDVGAFSSISTSSFDESSSGDIVIATSEKIRVQGSNAIITASTGLNTPGTAGNISILTQELEITDGASIRVGSNEGQAGELTISAQNLTLDQGEITAQTGESPNIDFNNANIILNVSDEIVLRNDSLITAETGGGANGGNILILNTPRLVATNDSGFNTSVNNIIADAPEGQGGNIIINAQEVIGFGPLDQNIGSISATGAVPGFVDVDTVTELNQGLIELPQTVIDPDSLIAQNPCSRGSESEYTLSGRGGLPGGVKQPLNNDQSQVGFVTLTTTSTAESPQATRPNISQSAALKKAANLPAQGWVYDQAGKIQLIAYQNQVTPESIRKPRSPQTCSS